jgi:predicted alpha/beta-fold hydrolase
MASWFGYARTTFTSGPETIPIPLMSSKKTDETAASLLDITKSLTPPCKLNPFLFNGHLQTGWTVIKGIDIPITYKRRIFESTSTVYPGSFAVDFVTPAQDPPETATVEEDLPTRTTLYTPDKFEALGSDDEKPMLILLHGLSGGSHEIYLRHVLRPLCLDAPEEERWEACVVNSRGCAHSRITSGVLYNARSTWDVRQVVDWIREKWPRRKLFGIGFSLGANILTNVRTVSLKWKTVSPNLSLGVKALIDVFLCANSILLKRARIANWMPRWSSRIRGT